MRESLKKYWRKYNEFAILLLGMIMFMTFQKYITPIYLFFYPNATGVAIETYTFGVLQKITLAILIIGIVGVISWLWHQWTFPAINKWMDDTLGNKIFEKDNAYKIDVYKALIAFGTYGFYVTICAWIFIALFKVA